MKENKKITFGLSLHSKEDPFTYNESDFWANAAATENKVKSPPSTGDVDIFTKIRIQSDCTRSHFNQTEDDKYR